MNPMNAMPAHPGVPPSWQPALPPNPPPSSAFWGNINVQDRLRELHETLALAKAMQKELDLLVAIRDAENFGKDEKKGGIEASVSEFREHLKDRNVQLDSQISCSVEAANSLMSKLRVQLEPFKVATDEKSPWEEKSAVLNLANRIRKSKRNKLWRARKRKQVAEMLAKECQQFDQADREADEWRAREIAKDIAKCKVEEMKEIAKVKAKEERKKLESELELVLIVEKLQELRSLRIQKLKKQGHFIPEEDDEFLERVRVAVEEEECAIAAADTEAAIDAIATAEESRRSNETFPSEDKVNQTFPSGGKVNVEEKGQIAELAGSRDSAVGTSDEIKQEVAEPKGHGGSYDSVANLPPEFYHYYHGSNNDMGTLIEVRRMWDAYIRPGGSCIPGHWIQPPPPADEIWASYLVKPR